MELDPDLARTEPDPEIQHLIRASDGLNLALDYLPGAVNFDPLVDRPDGDAGLAHRLVRCLHQQRRPHPAQHQPADVASPAAPDRPRRGAVLPPWLGRCRERQRRSPFTRIADHVLLPLGRRDCAKPTPRLSAHTGSRRTSSASWRWCRTSWLAGEPMPSPIRRRIARGLRRLLLRSASNSARPSCRRRSMHA